MNKKGFIAIYGVLLLNMLLPFTLMLLEKVKIAYIYHQENTIDFVEIHVIDKVKKDLLAYEEEDEQFSYLGYDVDLQYEDITCHILIYDKNEIVISSVLVFDDIEEEFVSYTYLVK